MNKVWVFIFAALLFASCDKQQNCEAELNNKLAGSWVGNTQSTIWADSVLQSELYFDSKVTFNLDNTGRWERVKLINGSQADEQNVHFFEYYYAPDAAIVDLLFSFSNEADSIAYDYSEPYEILMVDEDELEMRFIRQSITVDNVYMEYIKHWYLTRE